MRLGEREFLISADYGNAVMHASGGHVSESRAKSVKPFEWMSDEQFHHLQVCCSRVRYLLSVAMLLLAPYAVFGVNIVVH